MNILIVDDHLTNLKLLHALLEAEGHAVVEATDGAEALVKARQSPPHIIISDLLMPVMDGYTLLRHWKADDRLKTIPFIVHTATYTEPLDRRLALDLGADAFLVKPTGAGSFLACLQEVLARNACEQPKPPRQPATGDTALLKEYSEVLVHKLEEKAQELEQANRELTQALSEVRTLRGFLPICSYCKKIRDGKDYWQSVESYLSERMDVSFSHSFCPECYVKYVVPQLDKFRPHIPGPPGQ